MTPPATPDDRPAESAGAYRVLARKYRPKTFDDLEDSSFDLVITLSPEAHHRAMEMTRSMACEVEFPFNTRFASQTVFTP